MTYKVSIKMPTETVTDLSQSGYSLYSFIGTQCSNKGGYPLVWQKLDYSLNTALEITGNYEIYTSLAKKLSPGTLINANATYPIKIGQKFNVQDKNGTGKIEQCGIANAISIYNQVNTQFISGLSVEYISGLFNPVCAFSLYGNQSLIIFPQTIVLLLFSTVQVDNSTTISKSDSVSLLINLDSSNDDYEVNYDINTGWSWDNNSWGKLVSASTNIADLLITQPSSGSNPGHLTM